MTAELDGARGAHFVQSLERGLAVIRAFGADTPSLTLSEVARATGLTRAGARRFLLTLADLGYVRTDGRRFELTARVLELGYAYLSSISLPEVAEPHLERLVAEVHESSSVSVLDGDDIVYVARVPTARIMRVSINVGTRFPAYATSMGRVMLAGMDPRRARRLPRPRRAAAAVLAHDHLRAQAARRARSRAPPGLGDGRPGARGGPALGGGADPRPRRARGRGGQPVRTREPDLDRRGHDATLLPPLLATAGRIEADLRAPRRARRGGRRGERAGGRRPGPDAATARRGRARRREDRRGGRAARDQPALRAGRPAAGDRRRPRRPGALGRGGRRADDAAGAVHGRVRAGRPAARRARADGARARGLRAADRPRAPGSARSAPPARCSRRGWRSAWRSRSRRRCCRS